MKPPATRTGAKPSAFFPGPVPSVGDSASAIVLVSGLAVACAGGAEGDGVSARRAALEVANWTKLSAPAAATTRAAHLFVYDQARGNCVVFGGRAVDNAGRSLADTGIWSGDGWQPVTTQHARRGYVRGAFDTKRNVAVAFGGADLLLATPSYYADTWEFDGAAWAPRTSQRSPSKRSSNGLAYDSRRDVTVLFGGYDGAWKDDLWEWNGAEWTLRCDEPPCSTEPRPPARALSALVFDEARGVTVLFGGSADDHVYEDTWLWDGEGWTELQPAHVPPGRDAAATAYDPVSKRVLLFGGAAPPSRDLNDLWAWNGSDWSSIAQASLPVARRGAGLAWDVKRDRGVLFGGSASGTMTDAWELTLTENTCLRDADCHDGTCVNGTCSTEAPGSGGSAGSTGSASGGAPGPAPVGTGGTSSGGVSSSGGASSSATGGMREVPRGGAANGNGAGAGTLGGASPATGGGVSAIPANVESESTADARKSFYSCAAHPTGSSNRSALPVMIAILSLATGLRRRRAKSSPISEAEAGVP